MWVGKFNYTTANNNTKKYKRGKVTLTTVGDTSKMQKYRFKEQHYVLQFFIYLFLKYIF